MNKSLFWRRCSWVLLNSALFGVSYLWLFEKHEWAGNILKFWVGYSFFMSCLCFTKEAQKLCQEKGRSVPSWLPQVVDFGLALLLASQGHFVIAASFIFGAITESIAFDTKLQK